MFSSKIFTALSILALLILIAAVVIQSLEMNQYQLFETLLAGKN